MLGHCKVELARVGALSSSYVEKTNKSWSPCNLNPCNEPSARELGSLSHSTCQVCLAVGMRTKQLVYLVPAAPKSINEYSY